MARLKFFIILFLLLLLGDTALADKTNYKLSDSSTIKKLYFTGKKYPVKLVFEDIKQKDTKQKDISSDNSKIFYFNEENKKEKGRINDNGEVEAFIDTRGLEESKKYTIKLTIEKNEDNSIQFTVLHFKDHFKDSYISLNNNIYANELEIFRGEYKDPFKIKLEFKPSEQNTKKIDAFFYESYSNEKIIEVNEKGRVYAAVNTKNINKNSSGKITFSYSHPKKEDKTEIEYHEFYSKEIEITAIPTYSPIQSDSITGEIFAGVSFSNEYDEKGKSTGINNTDKLIWLKTDTLFPISNWTSFPITDCDFHLGTKIELSTFLSETENETDKQKKLSDSVDVSLNLLFQPEACAYYPERPSKRLKNEYDAFRTGLFLRPGLISRISKDLEGDTSIYKILAGFNLSYYQTDEHNFKDDRKNRRPTMFLEAAYGHFEEFAEETYSNRFVVDAGFSLLSVQKEVLPFYAGFHLNAGSGEDDLKLYIGLIYELEKINNFFSPFISNDN